MCVCVCVYRFNPSPTGGGVTKGLCICIRVTCIHAFVDCLRRVEGPITYNRARGRGGGTLILGICWVLGRLRSCWLTFFFFAIRS